MPFTETDRGDAKGKYEVAATHVATGLPLYVNIASNDANGFLTEADVDQILGDLYQIVSADPRFQITGANRIREARDAWVPPTPPDPELPLG